MAERLDDLLRACTVRVTGGRAPGAGFFVAPGLVLTCEHVVSGSGTLTVRWERDLRDPVEVAVTGPPVVVPGRGKPIPALECEYPDIAVLRVEGLAGHPCVLLEEERPVPGDMFLVFGYPSEGGAVLLTPASLSYRAPRGTAPTMFADLGSDTIKPGMSGSALLSLRTGGVCGVITASRHPERPDGGLAVPWAEIAADLPEVAAANQKFHEADGRWAAARRLLASPRPAPVPPPGAPDAVASSRRAHTEVVIEAAIDGGMLESATWVSGSLVCRRSAPLPADAAGMWAASGLPPGSAARDRLSTTGRRLAGALLDRDGEGLLAGLVSRLRPGDSAEVVLAADGQALSLPIELLRPRAGSGAEVGPLGLLPAVSVSRRSRAGASSLEDRPALRGAPPAGTAGPLKILAAVAAPDETKTFSLPLDAEAEMQAILDAVAGVAGGGQAQVRFLEVASLPAIRQALADDRYHVLHLSAHGSAEAVEMEDEDGAPVTVTPAELVSALQHAGQPVPLIVLSSCSGVSRRSG